MLLMLFILILGLVVVTTIIVVTLVCKVKKNNIDDDYKENKNNHKINLKQYYQENVDKLYKMQSQIENSKKQKLQEEDLKKVVNLDKEEKLVDNKKIAEKIVKNKKVKSSKTNKAGNIIKKSYVYLMLFIMYAPILLLIVFSFSDAQLIDFKLWTKFTLELYEKLFKNTEIMIALRNTFIVAISAAIISTIIGTLGAIGIFYSKKRTRKVYELVGQIPILNPEIVTALSLSILVVALGIGFNFFTLLVGHVVLTIPFVVLSITPKLKQLDTNVYEAALDLGAKPSVALRKVIIPEIMPGILSGFVLSITLSLDDYIITAFTKNSSFTTLSTYIYGSTAKKGNLPPELRALTTLIFVGTLLVLILINLYNNRQIKRIGGMTNEKKH